jgi:hypothetical protein
VQGTVFRVFQTATGTPVCELRRGYATYAAIQCMSFNVCRRGSFVTSITPAQADASMLLVSSDRQTIHIFKLAATEPQPQTWGGYFASFVPAAIGGYWTQGLCMACLSGLT